MVCLSWDLWLSCWTQEEIAAALFMPRQTVTDMVKDFVEIGKLSDLDKVAATFGDFKAPLYNVWKRQVKTNEVSELSRPSGSRTRATKASNLLQRCNKLVGWRFRRGARAAVGRGVSVRGAAAAGPPGRGRRSPSHRRCAIKSDPEPPFWMLMFSPPPHNTNRGNDGRYGI